MVDLKLLGEYTIHIDCDVIQADGGTRTASITRAWVALSIACEKLLLAGAITRNPMTDQVAAISCGIYEGMPVLDLDYAEDSAAETDANFILTAEGGIVEIQMTAEEKPFSKDEMNALITLAEKGVAEIAEMQRDAVKRGL